MYNIPQLFKELDQLLFNQVNNQIPRSKAKMFINKAINALTTYTKCQNITDFIGTNSIESIKTLAYEDVSGMPIEPLSIGTVIKVKINGAELEYKLTEGEATTKIPLIIVPHDALVAKENLHWRLTSNQIRIRKTITATELVQMNKSNIPLIQDIGKHYIIENAVLCCKFKSKAYKGAAGTEMLLNNGANIFSVSVDGLLESRDVFSKFTEVNKAIKAGSTKVMLTAPLSQGDSDVIIDVCFRLLE